MANVVVVIGQVFKVYGKGFLTKVWYQKGA
jgi:hypothetical protein